MDFLIAIGLIVCSAVAGIVGNIIASELYDCAPSFARWLIDRAVMRLPESERGRCREEWYADNDGWPGGKLGRVRHAAGCYLGARAVARVLRGATPKISREAKGTGLESRRIWISHRNDWLVAYEDELEEVNKIIVLGRQDRDHRSKQYERLREKLSAHLKQISDDLNSDGDLIDALVHWFATRNKEDDANNVDE